MVPIYNFIKYTNNHLKGSKILWQYFRDQLGKTNNTPLTDSESFKSKEKLTGNNSERGNANVVK